MLTSVLPLALLGFCLLGAARAVPALSAINGPASNATVKRTADSPKGVYAHFMVGNTYSYNQDTWKSNIQLAQANGIDGFALNVGSLDWEPGKVADAYADAYAAAQSLNSGFKLFMSLDMSSLPCAAPGDADLIRKYVNDHVNHPNQLYYQSQHILSTFWGDNCNFGQANFNDGWNFVIRNGAYDRIGFIPAFLNQDPSSFGSITVMNGIFQWNSGWPMGSTDNNYDRDALWRTNIGNRYYIAPVSPFFFTHYGPDTYNKNWIYRSDDWMYNTRWESLIANRDRIDFVEIVTWNDYGESHYIGPIGVDQPNSEGWVNGFDHQGLLAMTKYYATAWKTGTYPAITKNQVFLSSRPHSRNAVCTNDYVGRPDRADFTDDNLYAVVFAAQAGSLRLSIGSSSSTTAIDVGVNKIKLALSPGNPRAIFTSSSGQNLVDFSPSEYSYSGNSCTVYNFNYYVAASP